MLEIVFSSLFFAAFAVFSAAAFKAKERGSGVWALTLSLLFFVCLLIDADRLRDISVQGTHDFKEGDYQVACRAKDGRVLLIYRARSNNNEHMRAVFVRGNEFKIDVPGKGFAGHQQIAPCRDVSVKIWQEITFAIDENNKTQTEGNTSILGAQEK